jgi:hypothetical protein
VASSNGKRPSDGDLFRDLDRFRDMMRRMVRAGVTFHSFQKHAGRLYAHAAVDESDGNHCEAARKIGLHRNSMTRIINGQRVDSYGTTVPTASGGQNDEE